MHCLAFPSALFGAPFHIDNRTVADCGVWLEYASKTPLEVVADLPHRMRLFWLRCQIMRLRSIHIKPHYSQNAFDSALLAWYERGIGLVEACKLSLLSSGRKFKILVSSYQKYENIQGFQWWNWKFTNNQKCMWDPCFDICRPIICSTILLSVGITKTNVKWS